MTSLPKDGLRIVYTIVTEECADGTILAHLGDANGSISEALAGIGPTPLEAVRALCETIREWPLGGSERWLNGTPEGQAVQRRFCGKEGT